MVSYFLVGQTVLVRKMGAYPVSPDDGTTVVEVTLRNKFHTTPFNDTLPDTGDSFFYALFTYSEAGMVNTNAANHFAANAFTWSTVADVVRSGDAPLYFDIGDVFTLPHATLGTIHWQVAAFDNAVLLDASKTHSMTLLSVSTLTTMPLDAAEKAYATTADTTFQEGKKYYTYNGMGYDEAETLPGGAIPSATYYEANEPYYINSGRGHWGQSALRQYLNSSAGVGGWWNAQHIFDLPPAQASTIQGFMAGINDSEFLAAVAETVVPYAGDSITCKGLMYQATDRFFIPSRMEIFGPVWAPYDGILWPLYDCANDDDRIKYQSGTATAAQWFLRSAFPGSGAVQFVMGTGVMQATGPSVVLAVAPACVIG